MVLSKSNIQKLVSQHTRGRYTFQPLWVSDFSDSGPYSTVRLTDFNKTFTSKFFMSFLSHDLEVKFNSHKDCRVKIRKTKSSSLFEIVACKIQTAKKISFLDFDTAIFMGVELDLH